MNLEFEFIQVAMGLREQLSAAPSVNEWQTLFEFCKRQSLLGIGFAAVEKLHKMGMECPSTIRLQWYGYALKIERMNEKLNMQCDEISKRYEHDGLQCCILKGQGNLLNYPEILRMRRTPGDIDLWAIQINDEGLKIKDEGLKINDEGLKIKDEGLRIKDEGLKIKDEGLRIKDEGIDYVEYHGRRAVREYVRMQYRLQGIDAKPKACYHHIEAPSMDGTEVEVHYRPAFLRSPLRNWRMQRWFEHHAEECMNNKTHLGFSMMTSSVNVVYQMCHLFTHIFEGGIGLRQLMDYYFALRVWHNDVMECKDLQSQGMWSEGLGTPVMAKEEVMAVLRSFGMGKFAGAVMYVLHEVFAMQTRQLINDDRLLITDGVHTENTEENGSPQADGVGERLSINDERSRMKNYPWLLCEPNEKEGKKLLDEIMQGGNFGQYDTRDAALKKGGMIKHGLWKLKRVMRLISSYPEEALWEPVFRVWHLLWRGING